MYIITLRALDVSGYRHLFMCVYAGCVYTYIYSGPKSLMFDSFTAQSVLRQLHSLFQIKFYTECDLVLPLSICSILSLPQGHSVSAYVFFLIFPSSLPSLQQRVQKAVLMYDVPRQLDPTYYFLISHMIGTTDPLHPSPGQHFKTFQVSPIYFPK